MRKRSFFIAVQGSACVCPYHTSSCGHFHKESDRTCQQKKYEPSGHLARMQRTTSHRAYFRERRAIPVHVTDGGRSHVSTLLSRSEGKDDFVHGKLMSCNPS